MKYHLSQNEIVFILQNANYLQWQRVQIIVTVTKNVNYINIREKYILIYEKNIINIHGQNQSSLYFSSRNSTANNFHFRLHK